MTRPIHTPDPSCVVPAILFTVSFLGLAFPATAEMITVDFTSDRWIGRVTSW